MKHWYDGYVIGKGEHIYNPKSVIEAITRGNIENYWTQTEAYDSLQIYIDMNEDGLKEAIVQMLGGGHVVINTRTFKNDMTSFSRKDDVLTLLVHLGYLVYDRTDKSVYIPNEEVRQEFVCAVETGRHKEVTYCLSN